MERSVSVSLTHTRTHTVSRSEVTERRSGDRGSGGGAGWWFDSSSLECPRVTVQVESVCLNVWSMMMIVWYRFNITSLIGDVSVAVSSVFQLHFCLSSCWECVSQCCSQVTKPWIQVESRVRVLAPTVTESALWPAEHSTNRTESYSLLHRNWVQWTLESKSRVLEIRTGLEHYNTGVSSSVHTSTCMCVCVIVNEWVFNFLFSFHISFNVFRRNSSLFVSSQ